MTRAAAGVFLLAHAVIAYLAWSALTTELTRG